MSNAPHEVPAVDHRQATSGRLNHGLARLLAFVFVILSVWGWVLPLIGNAPTIRRSIDNAERMGINPAAVFYTDVYETTKIPKSL
jgi:hypothetical protein